jgi:gas vesicle structural protein
VSRSDFPVRPDDEFTLSELVNRVLDKGALISGDVVISVAGVDLVYLGLRVLISSVESMQEREARDRAAGRGGDAAGRADG